MPEIDPVTLRLFVEEKGAIASLNRYGRVADQQFSLVSRGAQSVERSLSSLGGVLAGVSAAALAASFLQIADASKSLDAQLRLATAGFGSFTQAQADVQRIAAATRSGLQETASLYGNFSRGAKELGADQEAAARATETFSKTLKISGADAGQSASATLQFGQALAAGALRGDELNSVLEASPRLARLLTESMGKPIGEIKALGEAGKLTSQVLLNALTNTKYTAGVDAEFRELPVTFDQAMTQVHNAAIITFGAFDRGGQFSTALANFVTDGADGFKDLERSAEEFGINARASIEGLASAFAPLFAEGKRLFDYLQSGVGNLKFDPGLELRDVDRVTKFFADDPLSRALGIKGTSLEKTYRDQRAASERRLRGEQGERKINDLISPYLDRFGRPVQRAAPARPTAAKPAGAKKTGGANSAEAAARKAENERLRDIRDEASKAREASRLQDDINAAKAALAVAANDVLAFNLADIESQRSQRVAEYQAQQKLGRLTDKELADRTASVNEIADLQRKRVQQIADEANRRDALDVAQGANQNQQDLYRAQADLTESRQERYAIELRLVQLAYDQERAELEGVLASQTSTQAQKDIAAARLRILGQLQDSAERSVDRQNEGPLARYRRDLGNPDRRNDQVEGAVIDELESVRDSISSGVQKTLGIKNPILEALINSFIEQQLIKPFLDQLSGAGGGGGFNPIGLLKGLIPGFATGTKSAPRGLAIVGERGRELVNFDGGERVYNNAETNALLNTRAAASMATISAARPVQTTIVKQTVHVDARNSVNPQGFAQQIIGLSSQIADQKVGMMGKALSKGMPSRLSSYQRDGT